MPTLTKIFQISALSLILSLNLVQAEEKQAPPAANTEQTTAVVESKPLQGAILETMNASGYTYLYLDAKEGKTWVAIPETKVQLGEVVSTAPGMVMKHFTSKTLNRTFEEIVFSPGLGAVASGNTPEQAKNPSQEGFAGALQAEQATPPAGKQEKITEAHNSPGSAGAVVPSAAIKVEKASGENSYSVAECFAQAKDLDGKTVRVRGKVLKNSRQIMGKNWLHLQDGTGDAAKKQHDLVVTTADDPVENSIVTIEGVLSANRDFGAGYSYEVIIENAKVVQQ